MINSFLISFKLKNAYKVNSIIYSLKQIPIIRKLLPNSLYKSNGLKMFANIISALIEFNSIFLGKLLYILLMILLPMSLYENGSNIFVHIFIFLTIIGGFINTHLFNPSKDKYYAMILMKFEAKQYTLSNYYYFLFKVLIGFMPLLVIFGIFNKIDPTVCLMLAVFVACVKTTISAFILYKDNKKNKITNENMPVLLTIIITVFLLICAYGLPFFGLIITSNIFYILFIISLISGFVSLKYIKSFNNYKRMYKELLSPNNVIFMVPNSTKNISIDTYRKQITNDGVITSNKEGYEYFNDIFVSRHKKILTKASQKMSIIFLLIFITLILTAIFYGKFNKDLNEYLRVSLPYFLFIMYFVNRGQNITQTMFMNCDHSMLFYRFYRQPSAILKLFRERLKTLIKLNLLPAVIIGSGLTILLFVTGGVENNIDYLLTFFTIIAYSIFFSVHYLVLYYLLQPYNINLEMKNPMFSIISSATYFICYFAIQLKIPTLLFGSCMIIFSIIYSLVALFLSYKYASKTFKLRN